MMSSGMFEYHSRGWGKTVAFANSCFWVSPSVKLSPKGGHYRETLQVRDLFGQIRRGGWEAPTSRVSHLSPNVNTLFCLILTVPTFVGEK